MQSNELLLLLCYRLNGHWFIMCGYCYVILYGVKGTVEFRIEFAVDLDLSFVTLIKNYVLFVFDFALQLVIYRYTHHLKCRLKYDQIGLCQVYK